MDALEWVHYKNIPKHKRPTYARYTVAFRPEKEEKWRVRITAGGDKLKYDGVVTTQVASLETFKILVNSTISTEGARMCTADISNMYLNSDLPEPEYVKFPANMVPTRIITHYNLTNYIMHGYLYARINKCWYGLKQSGLIAHNDLTELLKSHGYVKSTTTKGLFTHTKRNIAFILVVDDFAIKYTNKEDAEHLFTCLRSK